MTIKFHRLTVPSYAGGLPAEYDYINNALVGTPATADGVSAKAPHTGTYFIGYQDPATSTVANRPHKALAENCDHLDDLLRRPIAVPARTVDTSSGSPVAGVTVVDDVYCGDLATPTPAYINTLFSVVDDYDNDIVVSGTTVQVTAVLDAFGGADVVGDGFAASPYLEFTPPIPASQTYRIYYGAKGTLATLSTDALISIKIRNAQEVSGGVETALANLHGNNLSWNDPWTTNVWTLASSGLDDRYRRSVYSAAGAPPETYFSTEPLDAAGGGAWFERNGPAITGYTMAGQYSVDPANAVFAVKLRDSTHGGATGLVYYGQRQAGTNVADNAGRYPGSASLHHLWPHALTVNNGRTFIREWTDVQMVSGGGAAALSLVHSAVDFFYQSSQTAIALGYDMLEVVYTDNAVDYRELFVITKFVDAATVQIRRLDGESPVFSGTVDGVCRWVSSSILLGDGAGPYHDQVNTDSYPVLQDGLHYQVPPLLRSDGADDIARTPASFSAAKTDATAAAIRWGGFSYAIATAGPVWAGYLYGDGSIVATKVTARLAQSQNSGLVLDNTAANTFSMVDGDLVFCSSVTDTNGGANHIINLTNVAEGETVTIIITSGIAYTIDWGTINGNANRHYFATGEDDPGDFVRTMWVGHFAGGYMHWTRTLYPDP